MEQWTAARIAIEAGRSPTTGRDLVRRLRLVSVGRDQQSGAKLYDADVARSALADTTLRPGQGHRTDLSRREEPTS